MANELNNLAAWLDTKVEAARLTVEQAFAAMAVPVDPDEFLMTARIFDAVGRMVTPVSASNVPLRSGAAFAVRLFHHEDRTFNLALHSVAVVLEKEGKDDPTVMAYVARLGMLPDLYGVCAPVFREFLSTDPAEPGSIVVAQALIKAAAVAQLAFGPAHRAFDLADVLAHAREFATHRATEKH